MKELQDAYIQLTKDCNQDCIFCTQPKEKLSYSFDEIKSLLIRYKNTGFTRVVLTGGEPTVVPFLPETIKFVRSLGLGLRVITNGANLYDMDYCKKLKESGLDQVVISIHSHIPDIAEKITQDKFLSKSIQGVDNLLKLGIYVQINTTINSLNAPHLSEFIEYMTSRFPQIPHYGFNFVEVGGNAVKNAWIIPKHSQIENHLKKAMDIAIKKGKSLRVERVPLCYMGDHEEYSSEARRVLGNQKYATKFTDGHEQEFSSNEYIYAKNCNFCTLKGICLGVKKTYAQIHGTKELYPLFKDPNDLIKMNLSD